MPEYRRVQPRDGWVAALLAMVVLVLVAILVSGCGTWRDTVHRSLETFHHTAKGVSSVGEPWFAKRCEEIARKCPGLPCAPLSKCQADRNTFNHAVVSVHRTVILGKLAADISDKEQSQQAISKAMGILDTLRKLLAQYGIKI